MWQTWVVGVVVILAVGYAVWRIYRTLTYKDEACKDCPLLKSCNKNCAKDCPNC